MSLRIKDKVKKIRRSLSWHTSQEGGDNLNGLRGSFSHSSNNSFDQTGLPQGWESAIDKDGRVYYINHNENVSTYNDPRNQLDVEYEYAETRIIALSRDPQLGFGFVAGSERPVVVRCVTEGGPSDQLLLPGDQIHKIDSEDVRDAPRSRVIELVRSAAEELVLTVSQPPTISTQGKKSILLNAAKKQQRLKRDSSATRVRFCEDTLSTKKKRTALPIAGVQEVTTSNRVLRVYLETEQTRSFKYDGFTLVKDVLHALQDKLDIRCIEHFGLVIHNTRSPLSTKMTILSPQQKVKQVVEMLTDEDIRCVFRIVFVPRDAYDLLRKDSIAFQYFYTQCCQDVIHERFSSDLKCDVALRLASLHMQEYAIDKHVPFQKISVKLIEREFGLGIFLNPSMLRAVRPKELRKMLSHFMKLNQGLIAPGQKQVTPLQARLHYMKIVSELRSFGGKCFLATLVDRRVEVMLLVGPKCGISQVTDIKSYALHMLADFDLIKLITVQPEMSGATQLIHVLLTDKNLPTLALSMMNSDAKDFLIFVKGYHQLFCGSSDIIKYQSIGSLPPTNHDASGSTAILGSIAADIDCNMNGTNEPDYATIEDIILPNADEHTDDGARLDTKLSNGSNVTPRSRSEVKRTNVLIARVLSSDDETDGAPMPNHMIAVPQLANQDLTDHSSSTSSTPEHRYNTTPDESDETPPPMSSIDDLILNSSPDGSLSSPRDTNMASKVEGLADECITELNKLDQAGVLLNPGLFKDKGVYLNPQASTGALTVLPPPPDETMAQISPPAALPPPPALFNDSVESAQHEQMDREIGVQIEAIEALNARDVGDKESGIDSDDSGTETLNSTADNTPNLTPHAVPHTASAASVPTRDSASQQMPASSLRSRIQEQRARAKLIAENSTVQNLPIFYTPVKPDPITSSIHQSESSIRPDPVVSEPEQPQDIDTRMADALLQFTSQLPSDTESSNTSDAEAEESNVKVTTKTTTLTPPMMLGDSHVEVSTEEEDNTSIPSIDDGETCPDKADESLTEPMYMNCEIEVPDIPKVTPTEHKVAAAAIDEALNGLSSDSEDETSHKSTSPSKTADVPSSEAAPVATKNDLEMGNKRVSATIVITDSARKAKLLASITADEPQPQPPPRRRRGMKSATSMTSISTVGERPPSRASVTTIGSAMDDQSPRPLPAKGASAADSVQQSKLSATNHQRSVSNSSALSDTGSDRLSVGGSSHVSSEQPSPRFMRQFSDNPISGDLSMLRNRAKKRSKQDRLSRTASVIGMPTNITCTASDVLANCVPIVRDENSPRAKPNSPTTSNVTLTSRESLLDEIVKNAQGMGIDPLGLTGKETSRRRTSSDRASISSATSISSINILARPAIPPPQPPQTSISRNSSLKNSRSESDLLAAITSKPLALTQVKEAMLEVEYTVLDNKSQPDSSVIISRQQSVNSTSKPTSPAATNVSLLRAESTLDRASGLEKEGSFIKFTGYSGEASTSPTLHRKGRFRKKGATNSMALDHVIGESQGKRGIMSKILSTIKPRKRSMSLDRLNVDTSRRVESSSLKLTSDSSSRPSILPQGNGDSKSSGPFRSLGRTKFHSKPKMSISLTDLVSGAQMSDPEVTSSSISSRSHSIDCLLDPKANSQISSSNEEKEEVEEILTSGSKINPAGILNYTYQPHNAFEEAISHTKSLIEYFTAYCDTQWAPSLSPNPHNFTKVKETLISDGRQFVSNSKHLVAGVAQASGSTDAVLVNKMAASVRTLCKIVQKGIEALTVTTSEENMSSLRECVVTVSEAYYDVLETSYKAAGKGIQDENMQSIMQKASHLASLLSLFLKTLRALHEQEQ